MIKIDNKFLHKEWSLNFNMQNITFMSPYKLVVSFVLSKFSNHILYSDMVYPVLK